MFKAFGFVLALVLCTSTWSTAHAAVMARPTINWLWKEGTIYLTKPIRIKLPWGGVYEKEKINIPSPKDTAETVTVFSKAVVAAGAAFAAICTPFAWCRTRYITASEPTNTH
jgi:hypothetical protein